MSYGKLTCPHCTVEHQPDWSGYTPFYDTSYVRRFVIIKQDYLESVREIPLHAQVCISRELDTHAPAVIVPKVHCVRGLPKSKDRDGAVDLMPFLLRLWKDAELSRFAAENHVPVVSRDPVIECLEKPMEDLFPNLVNRIAGKIDPDFLPEVIDNANGTKSIVPPIGLKNLNGKYSKGKK